MVKVPKMQLDLIINITDAYIHWIMHACLHSSPEKEPKYGGNTFFCKIYICMLVFKFQQFRQILSYALAVKFQVVSESLSKYTLCCLWYLFGLNHVFLI